MKFFFFFAKSYEKKETFDLLFYGFKWLFNGILVCFYGRLESKQWSIWQFFTSRFIRSMAQRMSCHNYMLFQTIIDEMFVKFRVMNNILSFDSIVRQSWVTLSKFWNAKMFEHFFGKSCSYEIPKKICFQLFRQFFWGSVTPFEL